MPPIPFPPLYNIAKTFGIPLPLLSPVARGLIKAVTSGDYETIRGQYWAEVYDAVEGYLSSDRPTTSFYNKMAVAMSESFTATAYTGYQEAGGELPFDDVTSEWLGNKIATERQFIADLFARLKDGRAELDPINEALARADGYASTLDSVYTEAKMLGNKNKAATWRLGQTEQHCDTCSKLNGKRHRVRWFYERNYIPKKPDAAMDCHGYNCDCSLIDDDGYEITA